MFFMSSLLTVSFLLLYFQKKKGKPPLPEGISKARKSDNATDALEELATAKKKPTTGGVGRVRSMSPLVFMKKKSDSNITNEDETTQDGIAKQDESSTKKKSKLRSVRSMSPSLFNSDKSSDAVAKALKKSDKKSSSDDATNPVSDVSTAASSSSPASAGSKIILLPPSNEANVINNEEVSEEVNQLVNKIKKKITAKDAPAAGDDEARECITASPGSGRNATNEKKGVKSKKSALPPRIPSRKVPVDPPSQQQAQQVITSSDDDGSVECSVLQEENDEMLQLSTDGKVVDLAKKDAYSEAPYSEVSPIFALPADDGSVEVSAFDGLSQTSPKAFKASKENETKKKKKSRMQLAKAKLARHQPKSPGRGDGKQQQEETKKGAEAAPSIEKHDDKTIMSTTSSKLRKKEKLKKVSSCCIYGGH